MVPYYHSCSISMSVIGCCSLCHIYLAIKKFHLMKSGKMLGLPLQKTQRNIFVSVDNLEMMRICSPAIDIYTHRMMMKKKNIFFVDFP